ncbi:uncharacterized protein LOC109079530 isoform X2 [Cyprinus carpio]|uniref:Uncharacterized protein LOC109079530 isoform X2 n=1 Tax=Cyprinus carpio TaxID=7962 RepID=A0A9Q9X3U7_CYPCA|nr:uncharacterized protein LOC109079530 isoform X2 [Cyprinus carpio]
MMLNPSYTELDLYKTLNDGSTLTVFSIKKNKKYNYESRDISKFFKNVTLIINTHESIRNRSEFFFDNMTLTINNVTRADSGRYTSFVVEIDMAMSSDLQVNVEAPIGSVEVLIICSSNQTTVFCSSEGDQIIYSWTLNEKVLEEGLMFGNSSIDLDEGTDGNISCSVKNHVSHAQKTIRLKPCPADGSVGSVRSFSHLHETHVRKETGRSESEDEKIERRTCTHSRRFMRAAADHHIYEK